MTRDQPPSGAAVSIYARCPSKCWNGTRVTNVWDGSGEPCDRCGGTGIVEYTAINVVESL